MILEIIIMTGSPRTGKIDRYPIKLILRAGNTVPINGITKESMVDCSMSKVLKCFSSSSLTRPSYI